MAKQDDPNVVGLQDAARALKNRRRHDPPPAEKRNGAPPGKWTPNALGLPKEAPCPVEPIGFEGDLFHLIDSGRQFRSLTAADFSQAGIQGLFFMMPNYPKWAWPRYGRAPKVEPGEPEKKPPIKSFEADLVKEAIFGACGMKGLFSPKDKLRGRGAWQLRGGELVYHAGEELWRCDRTSGKFREMDTGMHEGLLYPRLAGIPAPWTGTIGLGELEATVGTLLKTFRKWNWDRPEVDPVLLLGWIGVAFLGGALDWRSAMLLVGDKGTGKSTLQDGLKALFGDALFHSADTTAAGIYQRMAHDARPVALDELEPGVDPRKHGQVVQLMRDASSGAMGRRGGADGAPAEFQMRSAFLFSAINNPIQSAQDLSRVAILRLRPLKHDQAQPDPIDADMCGRVVLAQVMREWPKFPGLLAFYRGVLAAGGHDARGQMTYGTLLACAELMMGPELAARLEVPLSEDGAYWREHLGVEQLPEIEDAMQNWRACAMHLLTVQVQMWRNGARTTVGKLLEDLSANSPDLTMGDARKELALTGLGLLLPGEVAPFEAGLVLAVPNASPLVADLFKGTQWAGQPGAAGPWKDALRQAPPDVVIRDRNKNKLWIAGVQHRCSLLVLKNFHSAPERD